MNTETSGHIGTPGERLGRRLVGVESITKLDSAKLRGADRWCVAFRDEDARRIVYFTNQFPNLRERTMMFVDGIVKRHGAHEGKDQTEITDIEFFRTAETVADYNVAERFRVLCYRIGIRGEIVAPRIVKLKCELPEDVDVAEAYALRAGRMLKVKMEVIKLDALTWECRLGGPIHD